MKALFQCEQLNYRGTTNSTLEYARYNQTVLGNESVIAYSSIPPKGKDVGTAEEIIGAIETEFKLVKYDNNDHLNKISAEYDFVYSQRAGERVDGLTQHVNPVIDTARFGVHCVFQYCDPHGDVYAYISEWLAKTVSQNYGKPLYPHVPYIVDMPPPNYDTRAHLGLSLIHI